MLSLLAIFLVAAGSARAEVSVTGSCEPDAIEVGDSAVLTIVVEGASSIDGDPKVSAPEGLSIRSAGESRSFSMVNGRISKSIQIQYVVIPLRPGSYSIGPVEVHAGGRAFTVGPYSLNATQGGSAPASPPSPGTPAPGTGDQTARGGTPPIFVDMRAEPPEVTIGQQTTLIVRFWQRDGVAVFDAQFMPAETEGFWKEDLTPERHTRAMRGGASYNVTEIRQALFPTRVGELSVSPARVRVQFREPGRDRSDPFSIFGFGGRDREAEPASNSCVIRVRPLPQPAPSTFTGAVGRYTIHADTDPDAGRQGEPLTWTVTIRGEGNVSTLAGPRFPDIPGCRSLDGGSNAKVTHDNDIVGGEKRFSRILIPESAGNLDLPSLSWAAFDPAEGRYVTMEVPARKITIGPASSAGADDGSRARIGAAIRGIRPEGRLQPLSAERPWSQTGFWLIQIVPIGALVAAFMLRRNRARLEQDPEGVRMRRAPRKLRAALQRVASEREDPWGALIRAIDAFLADRYGSEVGGMTRSSLAPYLVARGCDPEVAGALANLLREADALRYTPATAQRGEGIGRAVALAADLTARLEDAAHA